MNDEWWMMNDDMHDMHDMHDMLLYSVQYTHGRGGGLLHLLRFFSCKNQGFHCGILRPRATVNDSLLAFAEWSWYAWVSWFIAVGSGSGSRGLASWFEIDSCVVDGQRKIWDTGKTNRCSIIIELWISLGYSECTMIFWNPTNEVKSFKDTRYFFLHGLAWSPLKTSTRKGQTSSILALFGKGLKRNFCFQRPSSKSSGHMSHMRRGAHQRIW